MVNVRRFNLTVNQTGDGVLDDSLNTSLLVTHNLEETDIVLAIAAISETGVHIERNKTMKNSKERQDKERQSMGRFDQRCGEAGLRWRSRVIDRNKDEQVKGHE